MNKTLPERIAIWATDRFVSECKDSSAQDIANGIGVSVGAVYKCMREHGGSVPGLGCWQNTHPSSPVRRIWTYGPTREFLAIRLRMHTP